MVRMETCACSKNRRDFSLFSPCEQKLLPDTQRKEYYASLPSKKKWRTQQQRRFVQNIGTLYSLLLIVLCVIYSKLTKTRETIGIVLVSFLCVSLFVSFDDSHSVDKTINRLSVTFLSVLERVGLVLLKVEEVAQVFLSYLTGNVTSLYQQLRGFTVNVTVNFQR